MCMIKLAAFHTFRNPTRRTWTGETRPWIKACDLSICVLMFLLSFNIQLESDNVVQARSLPQADLLCQDWRNLTVEVSW